MMVPRSSRDLAMMAVHRQGRGVTRVAIRMRFGAVLFCALWGVFMLRSVDLALVGTLELPSVIATSIQSVRGDITDRNGRLLATNVDTVSLGIDPSAVTDMDAMVAQLAEVFPGIDKAGLKRKLSRKSRFSLIRRDLNREQEREILWRGIPGVHFTKDNRRIYPHGRVTSHVVGFADIDGHGLAGVEKSMNDSLADSPVRLTLDIRFQHALYVELRKAMLDTQAEGASGIIMDTRTSEITALVSLPDFDPHHPLSKADAPHALFNRAVSGVYEIGSSLKLFTVAMALESGSAKPDGLYEVGTPLRLGRRVVRDYQPRQGELTTEEIVQYSSNIGAAQLGMALGGDGQKSFLRRFGFFDALDIPIVEKARPLLPQRWDDHDVISVSFGYGMAVTPLHVASASTALVNGGIFRQPTLIAGSDKSQDVEYRVISNDTSNIMRRIMRRAVQAGTGSRARSSYDIGGKTGTANMMSSAGYDLSRNMVSFLGAFPMSEPRYVVFVLIEAPRNNDAKGNGTRGNDARRNDARMPMGGGANDARMPTGGQVAAPVVRRIVNRIAPLIGVPFQNMPPIRVVDDITGVKNVAVIGFD